MWRAGSTSSPSGATWTASTTWPSVRTGDASRPPAATGLRGFGTRPHPSRCRQPDDRAPGASEAIGLLDPGRDAPGRGRARPCTEVRPPAVRPSPRPGLSRRLSLSGEFVSWLILAASHPTYWARDTPERATRGLV